MLTLRNLDSQNNLFNTIKATLRIYFYKLKIYYTEPKVYYYREH